MTRVARFGRKTSPVRLVSLPNSDLAVTNSTERGQASENGEERSHVISIYIRAIQTVSKPCVGMPTLSSPIERDERCLVEY